MFDKSKLAERIRSIEGLSADERSALLELLNNQKKYGLVWEEKPEEVEQQLQNQLPVLTEVVEKRIIGAQMPSSASSGAQLSLVAENNNSAPNHILIEGDNLHALTCLSYTHEGKIDVIYIDPPYNTGNKDFVYNDRFVDTEDAYRHSKWLSFMHKRLRIARRLLSDRGVIFISIDDNEQANLKLLCDEVFGEGNFVATIVWKSKSGGANDSSAFGVDHEYIMCYANHIQNVILNNDKDAVVTTSYNKVDENGKRYALDRLDKQSLGYLESLDFPIIGLDGRKYVVEHKDPNNKRARWRWSKDTVEERFNELVFIYPYVYTKNYEKDGGQKPRSILFEERFGRTRTGSTDLEKVIGKQSVFSYPKPISLLHFLVDISTHASSTILDFFAGSGTTLHAVMQLNAEDGGHRQCILVANNENGICENVTYERNRRVINGYTTPRGQQVKSLHNNNLRYYRTTFVPREQNHHNRKLLVNAATDLLCIKNDCYYEQVIRYDGRKLRSDIARLFTQSKEQPAIQGSMLIIYEPDAISIIVRWLKEQIEKQSLSTPIKVYIFSDSSYAYTDDFADVLPYIELCALPEAIYRAYIQVLGKTKERIESHD